MWSDDYGESRMVRTRSLSKISSSVARQQYVDTSDEDDYPRYPPMYQQQPPYRRRNSRASSQENLGQAPPVRNDNQSLSFDCLVFICSSFSSHLFQKLEYEENESVCFCCGNSRCRLHRQKHWSYLTPRWMSWTSACLPSRVCWVAWRRRLNLLKRWELQEEQRILEFWNTCIKIHQ